MAGKPGLKLTTQKSSLHNVPKATGNNVSFESLQNLATEKITHQLGNLLNDLLATEQTNDYLSSELLKEAKKKARRRRR
jgi:hypothetical protein